MEGDVLVVILFQEFQKYQVNGSFKYWNWWLLLNVIDVLKKVIDVLREKVISLDLLINNLKLIMRVKRFFLLYLKKLLFCSQRKDKVVDYV